MDDADRPVMKAAGLALAILAKLLEAKQVLRPGELGEQLALLATVTGETDDEVGRVLGIFSVMASVGTRPPATSPHH